MDTEDILGMPTEDQDPNEFDEKVVMTGDESHNRFQPETLDSL
jgi:hypothetical protein